MSQLHNEYCLISAFFWIYIYIRDMIYSYIFIYMITVSSIGVSYICRKFSRESLLNIFFQLLKYCILNTSMDKYQVRKKMNWLRINLSRLSLFKKSRKIKQCYKWSMMYNKTVAKFRNLKKIMKFILRFSMLMLSIVFIFLLCFRHLSVKMFDNWKTLQIKIPLN